MECILVRILHVLGCVRPGQSTGWSFCNIGVTTIEDINSTSIMSAMG